MKIYITKYSEQSQNVNAQQVNILQTYMRMNLCAKVIEGKQQATYVC